MKLFFSLFISLLFYIPLICADTDSLVRFSELKFHSEFERKVFNEFNRNEKQDHFRLLLATDPGITENKYHSYKLFFSDLIEGLDQKKINKRKRSKGIKYLYDKIHDALFTKYELENDFASIFKNGSYNCVSATGIYALAFDKLGIEYNIKETPVHVYLIAYPYTDQILVETTDPAEGYFVFDEKFKKNYVTHLRDAKMISEQEFSSFTINELFDKYYSNDEHIGLKELAGLQYMNHGLYLAEDEDYKNALAFMEKAYYIYPSEKMEFILYNILLSLIDGNKYDSLNDLKLLAKISRFSKYGISNTNILHEFSKITQRYLIERNETEVYNKFANSFIRQITDTSLLKEIKFYYYYESGRALALQAKYSNAKNKIDSALVIKPNNLDAQSLYLMVVTNEVQGINDGIKLVEKLNPVAEKHPALLENNLFKTLLVNAYLISMGQLFDQQKIEALEYQQLFEEYYSENPDVKINSDLLGKAYGVGAAYYFRRGNNKKARTILQKGLKIDPENYALKQRLKALN